MKYAPAVLGLLLLFLAGAGPVQAQITLGDELTMKLNGSLGYGYSAGFGNQQDSNHTHSIVGDGVLNGSYYNPNFLSFEVHPFWNRIQNNTGTQSINRESGVSGNVNLFSGSYFPGYFSFGNTYSDNAVISSGGAGSFRSSGSSRNFGVGWSELLPDLPPAYVNVSTNSGSYSALGSSGENKDREFNLNTGTSYQWLGFALSSTYSYERFNFDYADLVGLASKSNGSTSSFSLGASHSIPLRGSLAFGFGHNTYNNGGNAERNGSSSNESVTVTMLPLARVSFGGQVQHTSNLSAALSHLLLSNGDYTDIVSDSDSSSLLTSGTVSVSVARGLGLSAYANRSKVDYDGRDVTNTQYGGNIHYQFQTGFLKMFRGSLGVTDNANKEGNTGTALVGNVSMNHNFRGWDASADYSYSQDMQTLYGMSVMSRHNYGGSVRRRFGEAKFWSGSFRGSHSGLGGREGSGSHSETLSSNISIARYSVAGSYAQSNGTSVVGVTGISDPITGLPLVTNNFLYSSGHSFSASGSVRLRHKLIFTGAYSKSYSNLNSTTSHNKNENSSYFTQLDWHLRKMIFMAGFSRTEQTSTTTGSQPYMVNSIYLRFSRWFNVF